MVKTLIICRRNGIAFCARHLVEFGAGAARNRRNILIIIIVEMINSFLYIYIKVFIEIIAYKRHDIVLNVGIIYQLI